MRRWLVLVLLSALLPQAATAPASPACVCDEARLINGWCERHAVGYVAALPIHSRLLFEQLDAHGHELDLTTFTCPACRKGIAESGYCDEHHLGFVGRLVYFSRLTFELARGERRDPLLIECAACIKNASWQGWCEKDHVGMVGQVAIMDRAAWQRAAHAMEIVRAADETAKRCEQCAIAMVIDGECPLCRITYKDGAKVKPGAVP